MDDIRNILINLASDFIWLPIGAVLAYLVFVFKARVPNRKLWRINDPANLVVCAAASTHTHTGAYSRPATGIGQVRAFALATSSLHQAYHKELDIRNILLSTEQLNDRYERDLLILGGPKNNEVTAHLLEHLSDVQPAFQVGSKLHWRVNTSGGQWVNHGADLFEGQALNEKVTSDYGLIIRCQNPFTSQERTTILFSGSHTYGTVAAAKFFIESVPNYLAKLTTNDRTNFVLLISTKIVEGYPTKMKIERSYAW